MSAAGGVAAAFQIGYAVSLVVTNLLADRVGARPVFLWSTVAGAPAALAFALLADGPLSAGLLYGLTALVVGGNYTPGLILIAERFPPATRGQATGFFLAATSIGYAGSLLLSGAVLARWGWRAALVATACGPVASYGFSAVGDSPVLSVSITEVVAPRVLGSVLAVRSLLGLGAGALAHGLLGVGGAAGLVSTIWLRWRPESRRLAGGRR